MTRAALASLAVAAVMVVGASCGGGNDSQTATTATVPAGGRCVVRLHGKGGTGAPPTTTGDVTVVSPTGNADGWGGRQWLYFPDAEYDKALASVTDAVAPCGPIIVDGFSNGASFAAAMYCNGETFDGTAAAGGRRRPGDRPRRGQLRTGPIGRGDAVRHRCPRGGCAAGVAVLGGGLDVRGR